MYSVHDFSNLCQVSVQLGVSPFVNQINKHNIKHLNKTTLTTRLQLAGDLQLDSKHIAREVTETQNSEMHSSIYIYNFILAKKKRDRECHTNVIRLFDSHIIIPPYSVNQRNCLQFTG